MMWVGREKNVLVCLVLLVGLVSQNVIKPVVGRSLQEFTENKNYYPPSAGGTPSNSHSGTPNCPTPSGGSHGSHHGGGSHTRTPSHGGSYSPPSGGSYTPTPSNGGSYSPPSGGGGSGGGYPPIVVPTPTTPSYPSPSTPIVDPHLPPFFTGTCSFWGSHPEVITAIFGSMGNIGDLFGHGCATIFGGNPTLADALKNTRPDGYGALFREGTAAFLNSMVNSKYPFTTQQVKSAFPGAITSLGAAEAQADLFKTANEGRFKP